MAAGLIFFAIVIAILLFLFFMGGRDGGKLKNNGSTLNIDWAVMVSDEIQQCLPDRKIEAIKHYREMTGVGLKEAKDAVEYAMAHPDLFPAGASVSGQKPKVVSSESGDLDWNVLLSPEMQQYMPDRKIDAIKLYRQKTGVGLKEAKDAIDEYFANPGNVPAKIRRYDLVDQQASGIRDLLRQGKRAEAQKTYQAFTGVDQFTASEAIDALEHEIQTEVERYDRMHGSDSHAMPSDDTYEDQQRRRQS